jgi:hypothetical protein
MNRAAIAFACLFAVAGTGCSSVERAVGQAVTIHGEVRNPNGSRASDVVVRVKGVYTAYPHVLPVVPNAVRLLKEARSDGAGRFSCRVPVYDEYYIEVGDFPKTKSGYATVQRRATKDTVIIEIK